VKFCTGTFFTTLSINTTYLRNETSHLQTKRLVSIDTVCVPKSLPTFLTFYTETAKIPWSIVTHSSAAIMLQPAYLRHVKLYNFDAY